MILYYICINFKNGKFGEKERHGKTMLKSNEKLKCSYYVHNNTPYFV